MSGSEAVTSSTYVALQYSILLSAKIAILIFYTLISLFYFQFEHIFFSFDLLHHTSNNYIYLTTAGEWLALKELDLRAAKKQVCKMTPETSAMFKLRHCIVRGGIIKKAKKGKGGKKKSKSQTA